MKKKKTKTLQKFTRHHNSFRFVPTCGGSVKSASGDCCTRHRRRRRRLATYPRVSRRITRGYNNVRARVCAAYDIGENNIRKKKKSKNRIEGRLEPVRVKNIIRGKKKKPQSGVLTARTGTI